MSLHVVVCERASAVAEAPHNAHYCPIGGCEFSEYASCYWQASQSGLSIEQNFMSVAGKSASLVAAAPPAAMVATAGLTGATAAGVVSGDALAPTGCDVPPLETALSSPPLPV
ncbi:MAG TPA: hypothetical protein PLJ65_04810, partial [Casimicrobium sp.]|nr:hypothetical protein [Casimicrobium sp.]